MPDTIIGYYDRTDPAKKYERHLFRTGFALQSAELNELQSAELARFKAMGDALFKSGDIVRDCACVVNPDTGATTVASGAVYVRGLVREVGSASFTVPTSGVIAIGLRLRETNITELDDPALRDPATGTRNYQEPGAARLKVEAVWGWNGDGEEGEFFAIYSVDNGVVQSKEPPPNLDSFNQGLARYDRDSSGGTYAVSGLQVQRLADELDGRQVYSFGAGRARVNGFGIEKPAALRFKFAPEKDLKLIDSEPHISTTLAAQVITLDRYPVNDVQEVVITKQTTQTLTHGAYTGVKDPIPDPSVLSIIEVHQGGTTYTQGADYKLTAGQVDWSLSGAEPAPGSTYTVTYQHMVSVAPTAITSSTITVEGAVVGSLVLVTYHQALLRVDRIALDAEGRPVWLKGVAAEWNPQAPAVPDAMLGLATIYQRWDDSTTVVNDAVRVVPMDEISGLNGRIDHVLMLVAQQRLESNLNLREAGSKKGLFTDPFLDDSQRDQGIEQTAAVVAGELTLPITGDAYELATTLPITTLAYNNVAILQQTLRTGSMQVNPYQAFDPIPANVTLAPALDRWTEVETVWASPITQRFSVGGGNASSTSTSTSTVLLSKTSTDLEKLRPIEVKFTASGFGPNEVLDYVTFDGVTVTATPV